MLNTRPASPVEFLARKKETPPCAMTKIRTCARKSTVGGDKGQGRVPGYCSPKGQSRAKTVTKEKFQGEGPQRKWKNGFRKSATNAENMITDHVTVQSGANTFNMDEEQQPNNNCTTPGRARWQRLAERHWICGVGGETHQVAQSVRRA